MTQKIALVFPGSGSQYVGMGKVIYDNFGVAHQTFEEANDVLGYDLSKICFEGSIIKLNRIENLLVSILVVSVAAFRVYMEQIGIPPIFLAGHSLGEYTALCCSEAISFHDVLLIVQKRAILAERVRKQTEGTMTVVKNISPALVEEICQNLSAEQQNVSIASYNSPEQVLISGHEKLVLAAEKAALQNGGEVVPFISSPPYHNSLMQTIVADLRTELTRYEWTNLRYPIIANTTALPYSSGDEIINNLLSQMYRPVLWKQTMDYCLDQGIEVVVEVGPQTVLKSLVQENGQKMLGLSMDNRDDYTLLEKIRENKDYEAGTSDDLNLRCKVIPMSLGIAVATRNNNPDLAAHNNFVTAYKKILSIKEDLEKNGTIPSDEHLLAVLKLLKVIFESRNTPAAEQQIRYRQLGEKTGINHLLQEFEVGGEHN